MEKLISKLKSKSSVKTDDVSHSISSSTDQGRKDDDNNNNCNDTILSKSDDKGLRGSKLVDGVLILPDSFEMTLDDKDEKFLTMNPPSSHGSLTSEGSLNDITAIEEEDVIVDGENEDETRKGPSRKSLYGEPKSEEILKMEMMPSDGEDPGGGLLCRARLLPDNFDADTKKLKICPPRDYNFEKGCIKPRRGNLSVRESDFFSSLVCINDENGGPRRYIFSGILNGWPALVCLELLKISFKGKLPRWQTFWSQRDDINTAPSYPKRGALQVTNDVRITLRLPPWSAYGWSKQSPGFFFWYEPQNNNRFHYGTNVLRNMEQETLPQPLCQNVHMVSHRYAKERENAKDLFVYHSFALLEWDHQQYVTVVEIGYLNGIAGYNGRTNWVHDKDDPSLPKLYKLLPSEMVAPWKDNLSEIRGWDLPNIANLEQFKQNYMQQYTGKDKRFVDVHYTFSHKVRLVFRSKLHIANYLINYIRRDRTYSEIDRNCQTFAADFCAFLAGKKDLQPFHAFNRIDYTNRKHYFLYDSTLYNK